MSIFKDFESKAKGTNLPLTEVLPQLKFNNAGLIPAIAQQYDTGEVLMMAWMNREALEETLRERQVCYWSRSRRALWRKGESSGQVQVLKELLIDCDGDTLLLKVNQTGPACHTGRRNCFFYKISDEKVEIDQDPLIDPKDLYN